jgi:hypothetical protein
MTSSRVANDGSSSTTDRRTMLSAPPSHTVINPDPIYPSMASARHGSQVGEFSRNETVPGPVSMARSTLLNTPQRDPSGNPDAIHYDGAVSYSPQGLGGLNADSREQMDEDEAPQAPSPPIVTEDITLMLILTEMTEHQRNDVMQRLRTDPLFGSPMAAMP